MWLWLLLVAVIMIAAIVFAVVWCWGRKPATKIPTRRSRLVLNEDPEKGGGGEGVEIFDMDIPLLDVRHATGNFNSNFVIGEGVYGVMYKGRSKTGQQWAVKRAKNPVIPASDELLREIEIIFRLSDPRVVKLLGYCETAKEQILIFEYVPNGNLKQHLRPKSPDRAVLPFPQRLQIACDVSNGLKLIHGAASPPALHRDVKSDNILMDKGFHAKLGDYGFLKLTVGQGEGGPASMAYVDPEFWATSKFTTQSDVYSFGIVLLELMSGQEPVITQKLETPSSSEVSSLQTLISWSSKLYEAGDMASIADKRLEGNFSSSQLSDVVQLALECTRAQSSLRPTIAEVVQRLETIQKNS